MPSQDNGVGILHWRLLESVLANFTDIYLLFTFGLSLRVNLESGLFSSLTILSDKIIFISTKWIFKFLSLLHYPPASLGRNGLEVSAAFLQPCVQPLHEPLFCISPVGMSGTFLLLLQPVCFLGERPVCSEVTSGGSLAFWLWVAFSW